MCHETEKPATTKIIHRPAEDSLPKAFEQMKRLFPALLGIYEFETQNGMPEPTTAELLKACGIDDGFAPDQRISVPADEGYTPQQGNIGGFLVFVTRDNGKDAPEERAVILLRFPQNADRIEMGIINYALALHEIGHLDDWQRSGLRRTESGQVDMEEAEFNAHVFACEKMRVSGFAPGLGFYLASLHNHVAMFPARAVAAQRVINLPGYKECRNIAGSAFDEWRERFLAAEKQSEHSLTRQKEVPLEIDGRTTSKGTSQSP